MSDKDILLLDWCDSSLQLVLEESTNRLTRFRGKFQEAESPNKNKRVYPYEILDENVRKLKEAIDDRRLIGELDHPTDSIVHFKNASHIVTRLWWEGHTLMGEGEILNTPSGKVLKALLEDGVKIGISSRGVGNGKVNEDGILVIGESYKLITFDAVADPSTHSAYQSKVSSRLTKESAILDIKNESCGIHNLNSEALIACLGGIIKDKTNEFKVRLQ